MSTRSLNRRERQARRQRKERLQRALSAGLLIAGVGVFALAGWSLRQRMQTPQASIDYGPEDISYERPLQAVHEMGGGPPIPFLPKSDPQPRIVVNEAFYDFGTLGPTDVVTRDFVIANTGEAPLTISRAYTTCGCTTADFTATIIPPGQVSIMTLRFDAGFHDVSGQTVRRGVIIESNDPNNSTTEIWVQASVR